MGRKKTVRTAEEAGQLADELIAENANKENALEVEFSEDETPPVDEGVADDSIDLSSLDEEAPEPEPEDPDKLAHKLAVLQGKYNAETERLTAMLSQTMSELSALKTRSGSRNEDEIIASRTPANIDADLEKLKVEYPSLYKGMLAAAKSEAKKEVEGTSQKMDAMIQQTVRDKRSNYYQELSTSLPMWQQINNHPAFFKWIDEPDGISGTPRRAFLADTFDRMDARGTLRFFNAFIKEKGIRVKGSSESSSEDIAPDTSGVSVNRKIGSQTGGITRAQIEKFYQDRAQNRFTGTEEDARKYEAKIMQAVKEGKVR